MARARANDKPRARIVRFPHRTRVWVSGAIAAALLAGVFVAEQMRLRQERERTELARQQFEAAMRITGETLEQARQQLQQAGVRVGTDGN
jgi:uncharacterized membrane protein YdfJ with MMPL/SSD domain